MGKGWLAAGIFAVLFSLAGSLSSSSLPDRGGRGCG